MIKVKTVFKIIFKKKKKSKSKFTTWVLTYQRRTTYVSDTDLQGRAYGDMETGPNQVLGG